MISTNETHSVQDFCELAFGHVGLNWQDHVVQDERFMRPAEVDLLIGSSAKAEKITRLEAQDIVPRSGHDDGRLRHGTGRVGDETPTSLAPSRSPLRPE